MGDISTRLLERLRGRRTRLEDLSDSELWRRSGDDDEEAFGVLFTRHGNAIYNACFRRTGSWSTAEDLMSVVFLEAWKKRGQVELISDSALPWLYGVTNNVCRNANRALQRYDAALRQMTPQEFDDESADVDAKLDAEREMRFILDAIDGLPPKEHDALVLCTIDGLEFAEAAAVLGVPVGTVASRVARARERLREKTSRNRDNAPSGAHRQHERRRAFETTEEE